MASNATMRATTLTYDRFGSKSNALIKMKKGYDDDKLHKLNWNQKIKSVDPRIATRSLETEIVRIPDDYDVEMVCFAHSEFEEAANYLEFENNNVKQVILNGQQLRFEDSWVGVKPWQKKVDTIVKMERP